jgi:hypothetical protein
MRKRVTDAVETCLVRGYDLADILCSEKTDVEIADALLNRLPKAATEGHRWLLCMLIREGRRAPSSS